jgi:hypothetical protein
LHGNCLLNEGKIEGRIEGKKRRGKMSKQLLNDFKEKTGYWKFETGDFRWHYMENSLWKKVRTGHKTDYVLRVNNTFKLIRTRGHNFLNF